MITPPASGFLIHFSIKSRSAIANRFFKSVREGATTPEEVLRAVKADTIARMLFASREVWNDERRLLSLLEGKEVRLYIKEVLDRESLPTEEKQRLKAVRSDQYRQEYLRAQKPTERQLRYLKYLGCPTIPSDRLEASELIEQSKEVAAA